MTQWIRYLHGAAFSDARSLWVLPCGLIWLIALSVAARYLWLQSKTSIEIALKSGIWLNFLRGIPARTARLLKSIFRNASLGTSAWYPLVFAGVCSGLFVFAMTRADNHISELDWVYVQKSVGKWDYDLLLPDGSTMHAHYCEDEPEPEYDAG